MSVDKPQPVVSTVMFTLTQTGTFPMPTTLVSVNTSLPWVGGVIIGAVLTAAILLTVLAAMCLLRKRERSRTHLQHNM